MICSEALHWFHSTKPKQMVPSQEYRITFSHLVKAFSNLDWSKSTKATSQK